MTNLNNMTNQINIFELASQLKLRFNFKGAISTEDLWDLSLENLNLIFKDLRSHITDLNKDSLIQEKTEIDKILELKIDIVKYIFNKKQIEKQEQIIAKTKKEKNQKILEILHHKQNEELKNKSIDELMEMLQD